jgi:hypothetical protein
MVTSPVLPLPTATSNMHVTRGHSENKKMATENGGSIFLYLLNIPSIRITHHFVFVLNYSNIPAYTTPN